MSPCIVCVKAHAVKPCCAAYIPPPCLCSYLTDAWRQVHGFTTFLRQLWNLYFTCIRCMRSEPYSGCIITPSTLDSINNDTILWLHPCSASSLFRLSRPLEEKDEAIHDWALTLRSVWSIIIAQGILPSFLWLLWQAFHHSVIFNISPPYACCMSLGKSPPLLIKH